MHMREATRLLLIDDDKDLLMGPAATLRREEGFQVMTAEDGNLGIQLAQEFPPHIIICDLMMPPPDGWTVLRSLSRNPATATVPFIFLTALAQQSIKERGLELGADDYITKPFSTNELVMRIRAIRRRMEFTVDYERIGKDAEIKELLARTRDLIKNNIDHSSLAEGMAQMLSLRDNETEEHARRVVDLCAMMGRKLDLPEKDLDQIRLGALLHDIGKVGVPDSILLKNGILTDDERKVMMGHTALGRTILEPLGLPDEVLELVFHHHERWDGTGYPDGLSGETIPISARIFSIVDVWDALSNDRPYRKAWPLEQIYDYIKDQSGKHFDPSLVEMFLTVFPEKTANLVMQGGKHEK